MKLLDKQLLITGGAGMVGSNLADRLVSDNDVIVADDLSNGHREWVPNQAEFVHCDLTDGKRVSDLISSDIDVVFHLAASKHVNTEAPRKQFEENNSMTYNILERMGEMGLSKIAFTSSSTIYGEAPRPTPEDYAPLEPISPYAASKLGEEGLISTYAHSHEFTVWNFRFANIVGPRLRDAVIPDFIEKLRQNSDRLRILGDGRQEKSFMHVDECLDAMQYIIEHADDRMNTYNIGTRTTTSVNRIADIVTSEMGLSPEYEYTGNDRGWTGDVPRMRLSVEKLDALGWQPQQSSDEAVSQATGELLAEIGS